MTREEEIVETAKLIYSPSSGIPQSLSMRVGFIEGAKWADEHPNLNEKEQIRMGELGIIRQKKSLIGKVCNWLKTQVSIDWDKLKKSIISAIFVFGVVTIIVACIAGIGYIAMTYPLIEAIIIELFILFCLLVVVYYLIL